MLSLLLFASNGVMSSHSQTVVSYSSARFDGRVLVVRLGPSSYGLSERFSPGPDINSNGRALLSLVHSGYSDADPDGKSALLSVTLTSKAVTLTNAEVQQLKDEGIIIGLGNLVLPTPTIAILDVQLRSNLKEEARIRKLLNLPQTIQIQSKVPIQIRWKGVPGKTLYDWLVAEQGLRFTFTTVSEISWKPLVDPLTTQSALEAWWKERFGEADRIKVTEGLLPITLDLLQHIGAIRSSRIPTHFDSESAIYFRHFRDVFVSVGEKDNDGSFSLIRAKLLSAEWTPGEVGLLSLSLRGFVGYSTGPDFIAYPELVKDLSGNSKGLDALRDDPG